MTYLKGNSHRLIEHDLRYDESHEKVKVHDGEVNGKSRSKIKIFPGTI